MAARGWEVVEKQEVGLKVQTFSYKIIIFCESNVQSNGYS